jgi:hypothetical protein
MNPSLIVAHEALEKVFEHLEIIDTGFLCAECFAPVRHATDRDYIFCRCDCYARVFDDPSKVERLTAQTWLEYIQKSVGWKSFRAAENGQIINPSQSPNYDCWCPSCARDRKIGAKVVWTSPAGSYVCTYGTCVQCAQAMQTLSKDEATQKVELCEDRLLERYPSLQDRLSGDPPPIKKQPVALVVIDTTPDRTAWELMRDGAPQAVRQAPRLSTPDGFILFMSASDAPASAETFDGATRHPFPGVEITLRVGKSARALWDWAQQFNNRNN